MYRFKKRADTGANDVIIHANLSFECPATHFVKGVRKRIDLVFALMCLLFASTKNYITIDRANNIITAKQFIYFPA
jgi:hypothetical protein